MSLSDLTDLAAQRLGMRKSFSIDSSLSCVSHHATPRAHENRPQEQRGKGLGLTGLNTLHEDRDRSPPVLSPRSPLPPRLTPSSAIGISNPPAAAAPQPQRSLLRGALLVTATAVLLVAAAVAVAPTSMSHVLGMARDYHGRNAEANHTQVAAGCSDVEAIHDFDLQRFMGDWQQIAWLHSTSEAAAWEKMVGQQCTTATFRPQQRPRRTSKRQPPLCAPSCGNESSTASSGSGNSNGGNSSARNSSSRLGGGRAGQIPPGAAFNVTFTHRLLQVADATAGPSGAWPAPAVNVMQGADSRVEVGKGLLEQTSPIQEDLGCLTLCDLNATQLRLESGHVLPYWVVATDYSSWALMCTTSASLGGGRPAQVLALLSRTWAQDRLDIGDRLNELADRNLPWKEVVFAPSAACAAAAAAATATV